MGIAKRFSFILLPERKGSRGKQPTKLVPDVPAVAVSSIAADDELPWKEIGLAEGAKGSIRTQVKMCRIVEVQDGKDGEELWLYICKYEDGRIKYVLTYALADIDIQELHHAAILRWSIEQSFLFVLEVRKKFQKKTKLAMQ